MKKPFALLLAALFVLSGCAEFTGTKTTNYRKDGSISKEILELAEQEMADIERERTRQVCYVNEGSKEEKIREDNKDNPLVLVMHGQTKALMNAMSLLATGKNYDPCPSSTNSQDADIAESKMYGGMFGDFMGATTAVGLGYLGYKAFDSLIGALASGSTAYNINNSEDGVMTFDDSFKTVGDVSGTSNAVMDSTTVSEKTYSLDYDYSYEYSYEYDYGYDYNYNTVD